MTFFSLLRNIQVAVHTTVCPHRHNPNDWVTLKSIQEDLIWCTLSWFGHSYVSVTYFTELGIHYGILVTSECQGKICK